MPESLKDRRKTTELSMLRIQIDPNLLAATGGSDTMAFKGHIDKVIDLEPDPLGVLANDSKVLLRDSHDLRTIMLHIELQRHGRRPQFW